MLRHRKRPGEYFADRQQWPCWPEEEEWRRLIDEEGWSYYRLSLKTKVQSMRIWEGVWRARVEHDPENAITVLKEKYSAELEALERFERGTSREQVRALLQEKRGRAVSRNQVTSALNLGRWVRVWIRRAEELLQDYERKGQSKAPTNGRGRPMSKKVQRIVQALRKGATVDAVAERFGISAKYARTIRSRYVARSNVTQ